MNLLVGFEHFVREGFLIGEHVVSIFFDLEKAYDTTWKYGIMKDLYKCSSISLDSKLTFVMPVNSG